MVATEEKILASIDAPDFYWKYRVERLAMKKSSDITFKASNYPDAHSSKDLYDAYYLDLTLQGKLDGFDWVGEKSISDAEWLAIYKSICQWTTTTVQSNKPSTTSLPSNEFDLLKQFYPQLNYRDLETLFTVDEVGERFPYRNLKELFSAAASGKLNLPQYSSVTSLDASEIRKDIASLRDKTMTKVDDIYNKALTYASNPLPDEESKSHYQKLRAQLATFPQTSQEWATYRTSMEKTVDEMSVLAAKLDEEEHHHHDEGEAHISPAQEFENKYGKNLDDMQDLMSKYKQNPESFFETTILDKYGKTGLDILTKSQEFSAKFSVLSESERVSTENSFKEFLKKA